MSPLVPANEHPKGEQTAVDSYDIYAWKTSKEQIGCWCFRTKDGVTLELSFITCYLPCPLLAKKTSIDIKSDQGV